MTDVDKLVERYFKVFNPHKLTQKEIDELTKEVQKNEDSK